MPAKAFLPMPKPRKRIEDRIAEKLAREQRDRDFRKAVWMRDRSLCRACGRRVRRTLELVAERGEIHHRRGRNVTPEDRFNVEQAVLLCGSCHRDSGVIQRFRSQER